MSREYYVYFAVDNIGNIKIGVSTNPVPRCAEIGTHLIGYKPGGFDEEIRLHRRFSHLAVASEWFRPTMEILEFIGNEQLQFPTNNKHALHMLGVRQPGYSLNGFDMSAGQPYMRQEKREPASRTWPTPAERSRAAKKPKRVSDPRVPLDECKRRALACLPTDPKQILKCSEVGMRIWPDKDMQPRGRGSAAARILRLLKKDGLVKWVSNGSSYWGFVRVTPSTGASA